MKITTHTPMIALLGFLTFLSTALAIQANLAGIVDWHKPLIGLPVLDPTPPTLVESSAGRRVVSITKSNVLAVLNAEDGDVVWRYQLEDADPVVSYHVRDDVVILLSGPSGTTVRLFSLETGGVRWEKPLHSTAGAHLTSPVHLGTDVDFTADGSSVVILSDGRRITKLGMADGKLEWSLEAPGAGDTVLFKQILVSSETVHTLALTSSFESTTLTTLSFDLRTSRPLGDFTQIPSWIPNPSQAALTSANGEGAAKVVWFEHGRIRTAYLSAQGALGSTKDMVAGQAKLFKEIVNTQARRRGLILGMNQFGGVHVVDVNQGKAIDEFENSRDSDDKSPSVYSAAVGKDSVTFNRVYWSFSMGLAVAETNTISSSGEAITTGFTFPFDTNSHGVVLAGAVNSNIGPKQLPHVVLTTSNGAIQLISQEKLFWTREEALSDLAAVKFIELGEREVEEARHVLAEEGFVARTLRHAVELKDLPAYLYRFVRRFTSSSYASTLYTPALNATNLHRDQFGLQKLLVAVSKSGRVFAMDSSNGQNVWTRNLGLTGVNGTELYVKGMWVVREVGEGVNPTLAVIASRTRGGITSTVGFHIDAFTGVVANGEGKQVQDLGKELFSGRAETVFLTPFTNCGTENRVLAVVDEEEKVHIFPSCKKVASDLQAISSELFFTTTTPSLSGATLSGHILSARNGTQFQSTEVWSIPFVDGDILTSTTPVANGAIASFGRAVGDKSTLYKYLNPHLVVLTVINAQKSAGRVVVVDSTSGRQVYDVALGDIVTSKGVQVAMSENWLVYSYLDKAGWRIGSVELYEDRRNDKAQTPGLSSFASGHSAVDGWAAQTFIAPSAVKSLAITTSKFGVTAKDLIYINDRNQIATIPRRLLDPRRPTGKPSASDKEEMLIPYEPALQTSVKSVVSHKYQILGAKHLTSSPALVESTSLLLVHGLDLFFSRGVTPSGTFDILTDSFNKAQLLLTLAVLSVGIAVAKPAVQRKNLTAKWF